MCIPLLTRLQYREVWSRSRLNLYLFWHRIGPWWDTPGESTGNKEVSLGARRNNSPSRPTDSSSFLTPALFARLSLRNHNYSSNKTHPKIINRISLRYWVMYQVHVYTNIHTQPWLMRKESRWGLIAEEQPFNTWSLQLVNMRPVRTVKHTNQLNSDLP